MPHLWRTPCWCGACDSGGKYYFHQNLWSKVTLLGYVDYPPHSLRSPGLAPDLAPPVQWWWMEPAERQVQEVGVELEAPRVSDAQRGRPGGAAQWAPRCSTAQSAPSRSAAARWEPQEGAPRWAPRSCTALLHSPQCLGRSWRPGLVWRKEYSLVRVRGEREEQVGLDPPGLVKRGGQYC